MYSLTNYMKITKFGHSCVLVEEQEARILIDPGMWSDVTRVPRMDAIFITHEHMDHCHPETLKTILQNYPSTTVYTNNGAGAKLTEQRISYELFEDGSRVEVNGVTVTGVGKDHAHIYDIFPRFDNTGILIANRFFHPGDSVASLPDSQVEILALPIVAPWARLADSLDFAKKINPRVCFPIHDGFLKFLGPYENVSKKVFDQTDIDFTILENERAVEY